MFIYIYIYIYRSDSSCLANKKVNHRETPRKNIKCNRVWESLKLLFCRCGQCVKQEQGSRILSQEPVSHNSTATRDPSLLEENESLCFSPGLTSFFLVFDPNFIHFFVSFCSLSLATCFCATWRAREGSGKPKLTLYPLSTKPSGYKSTRFELSQPLVFQIKCELYDWIVPMWHNASRLCVSMLTLITFGCKAYFVINHGNNMTRRAI